MMNRQPNEAFKYIQEAQEWWIRTGLPAKEEITDTLLINEIQKIVKNIFNKPFNGAPEIQENIFANMLEPKKMGFYDIALHIMIFGKLKAYIIDTTDVSFSSKNQLDEQGYKLRADNIRFGGFLESLPEGIHENDIDPSLILNIDITKSSTHKPLKKILQPFYDYYYNILVNLNYSLMVANTPQIKLNKYRELMMQKETGASNKALNETFLRRQMTHIKNAFKSGSGNSAIYLDGGDSIVFDLPNMERYTKAFEILHQLIANAIDAPVSYLFGLAPQGMNATGDKDSEQWNNLAKFWYNYTVDPLFKRIENLFSLERSSIDFSDYTKQYEKMNNISQNGLFLRNALTRKDNEISLLESEQLDKVLKGYTRG